MASSEYVMCGSGLWHACVRRDDVTVARVQEIILELEDEKRMFAGVRLTAREEEEMCAPCLPCFIYHLFNEVSVSCLLTISSVYVMIMDGS